jgi:hypothetical protein
VSVICKVYISAVRPLGNNARLVLTQCVADSEVMANYNPDAEDKLFSRASPSGSAELVVTDQHAIPQGLGLHQDKLYLVFTRAAERPATAGAIALCSIYVASRSSFGGTSDQFQFRANYIDRSVKLEWPMISQFAHQIMIDNPGASDQLEPGQRDWWVAIYDCATTTMAEALEDAHHAPAVT